LARGYVSIVKCPMWVTMTSRRDFNTTGLHNLTLLTV